MQRAQVGVQRIVRRRNTEALVPCQFGDVEDRIRGVMGTCGALIPFKPRKPCPACGRTQINAHAPAPPEGGLVVDGNAAIVDEETGNVVALQVVAVADLANRIADQLRSIGWDAPINARNKSSNEGRLSGIVVTHRTFGFTPPVPLRRRWSCARSRFDYEQPEAMALIEEYCRAAEHIFRTQAPEVYEQTAHKVREWIPGAWLISGTPWTSGIINHTAALPYHKDSGNIPGSWSAMLTSRRNVDGGLLHLVDYDCWLKVPNGSIAIFDGQSVLHGVTPFHFAAPNAYRFTLVTYARKGMKVCCPDPSGEPHRAAVAATEADNRKRAKA